MRSTPLLLATAAALLAPIGCHALKPAPFSESSRRQTDGAAYLAHPIAVGQLVVHADFPLPENHRLLAELAAERDTILQRLELTPSPTPIHVHLFADESGYRRHVSREFPGFPERRAIFVESEGALAVYAHWNESIAEDLRHEVAHGYLHASVPNLPLWLDEGLAEYFEVSRGLQAVNQVHRDYLAGQHAVGAWRPDLPRLERLNDAQQMTQLDYAEAWLWVHWLLDGPADNRAILTRYVADMQTRPEAAAPISTRLASRADSSTRLVQHLQSLPHR